MLALLVNLLRLVLDIHFNCFIAFVLDIEVLDWLLRFIPEEQHTLQIIFGCVEIVDETCLHTDLYDLILEQDALRLKTIGLESMLLIL